LNRTLNRLFAEVRREAKRNKAFADRLEAAILAHRSEREVDVALIDADAVQEEKGAHSAPVNLPEFNPVALLTRDGPDALAAALTPFARAALAKLVHEHNLDPAGETEGLDEPKLIAHIVLAAKKRIERDRKLFDY
jgi:hypothetical protein